MQQKENTTSNLNKISLCPKILGTYIIVQQSKQYYYYYYLIGSLKHNKIIYNKFNKTLILNKKRKKSLAGGL